MFLQVGVKKEDRSALRFLWRPPALSPVRRLKFGL
jgi:hypothetical protein